MDYGTGQELTAGQIAATEPVTASPFDSLADVAQVMGDHDVAHLVVVDAKHGEPMGVISTLDLARRGRRRLGGRASWLRAAASMTSAVGPATTSLIQAGRAPPAAGRRHGR